MNEKTAKQTYLDFDRTCATATCTSSRPKNGACSLIFSPPQVPHKYPTSAPQVEDKLHTDNSDIIRLVHTVGERELSATEIMTGLGLKDRKNVLNLYLNPAISEGYIRLLYPQSPRHPRQRYLLTVKGVALYQELTKEKLK